MSKTVAVFGAGSGLGASVAHRFGRAGYRVALVARRKDRLDALVAELSAAGVDATAYPADLSDVGAMPALVEAIGRVDVLEYAPVTRVFVPAADLDVETSRQQLNVYLLTPVELIRAVLPGMLDRGDGVTKLPPVAARRSGGQGRLRGVDDRQSARAAQRVPRRTPFDATSSR